MINVIADRYAQALFEVGEETQTTSAVSYTHLTLPTNSRV